MPRLSVIVPGYNTPEKWWKRCVASILASIGQDDEVIVVDDGSKEALAVQESWWAGEARVRVVRQANGGLSRARNAGLKGCQGEFVTFVDSDDEVVPGVYDQTIAEMQKTSSDIGLFGVRTIWVQEKLQKEDVPPLKAYGELSPQELDGLIRKCLFNYAWNKVYRRNVVKEEQFPFLFYPEGMPCEDIIFNLQRVMAGCTWCTIDTVGYIYYRMGTTLLSRFIPTYEAAMRYNAETWKLYKERTKGAREIFGSRGEISEQDLLAALKRNQLRAGSSGFRAMAYAFARKWLYLPAIRRWRFRRQYPHATVWSGKPSR